MANELREYVIGLGVSGQADAEFRELQRIMHYAFFKSTLVGNPVGRARAQRQTVWSGRTMLV